MRMELPLSLSPLPCQHTRVLLVLVGGATCAGRPACVLWSEWRRWCGELMHVSEMDFEWMAYKQLLRAERLDCFCLFVGDYTGAGVP